MRRATTLLQRLAGGDQSAADELVPLVYDELHRVACRYMARERPGHTLQPTALVSEAWARLVGGELPGWENRAQFFRLAARAMRNVLVDHARAKGARKRGRWNEKETASLDRLAEAFQQPLIDFLALHSSLEELSGLDPEAARVVELRFFSGLSVPETARVLETSVSTVERRWRLARAWLRKELGGVELAEPESSGILEH